MIVKIDEQGNFKFLKREPMSSNSCNWQEIKASKRNLKELEKAVQVLKGRLIPP